MGTSTELASRPGGQVDKRLLREQCLLEGYRLDSDNRRGGEATGYGLHEAAVC
ncbi:MULTISPECIES: hypothetical protein [Rhodococcus]|uniref:hypothetical protein n=1 Tax=Rhodococcus TaxID=1827 RepID=UPI0002E1F8A3|nr:MULTISPECIES: hypothetical protein [Rhodococcus]QQZ17061.1 hypothetical protein GO592_13555 [Rhodococcus sp. 21391]